MNRIDRNDLSHMDGKKGGCICLCNTIRMCVGRMYMQSIFYTYDLTEAKARSSDFEFDDIRMPFVSFPYEIR